MKNYHVVMEPGGEGWITVTVPELPGCISQGRTKKEALVNINDAIQGYLECIRRHPEARPKNVMTVRA